MKLGYFPGCTLKTNAKHFEDSAMQVMDILGSPLEEMKDWVCCGTVFSMSTDDLMLQLSSIRNLLRAEEQGYDELVTLCSMCYNTLKRAKEFVLNDEENLRKVNEFMYKEETSFRGGTEVTHLLNILKDRIGLKQIASKVLKPLKDLKIGAYYGCLLVRPKELAIDDFEDPVIMEEMINALGGEGIPFPYRLECCGAYQTVTELDVTIKRTYEIINSAQESGCEALITSCPLCAFNLDQRQKETSQEFLEFTPMPIFYFTELMAIALGGKWNREWKKLHYVNPETVLKNKNLI